MTEYEKLVKKIEEHAKAVENFNTMLAKANSTLDIDGLKRKEEHNKLVRESSKKELVPLPANKDITNNYCYDNVFNLISVDNDNKQLSIADISTFMKYEKKSNKQYNKCSNINDFITTAYKPLSIAIIKSMYCGLRKKKDGDFIPSANYNAIHQIVENGYNDNLIDDIAQEIALVLIENKEELQKDKNGYYTFDNSDIVLKCYRAINKFLYSYKTRNELKHVSICGWNDDTKEDISLKNDSLEWRLHIINTDYNRKTKEDVAQLVYDILDKISHNEKPFIYEKCKKVFSGMLTGLSLKEISKKYAISINSVTKYKNIILNTYFSIKDDKEEQIILSVSKYNINNSKLVNVNKKLK